MDASLFVSFVRLHCDLGTSDKIYEVGIAPDPGGLYVVRFAYGRRGSALKEGLKTASPLPLARAERVMSDLVGAKKQKGYRVILRRSDDPVVPPLTVPPRAAPLVADPRLVTDPGLPVDFSLEALPSLVSALGLCAQPKHDGVRRLITKTSRGEVFAQNKKGQLRPATDLEQNIAQSLPEGTVLDGEMVGDCYFCFDLLVLEGINLRPRPLAQRLRVLRELGQIDGMKLVTTARSPEEKEQLANRLQREGGEGMVFKDLGAAYPEGRAVDRSWIKCKFVASASCLVDQVNRGKRSVRLQLLDLCHLPLDVGSVTIPPNADIPPEGSVVEVRYLYATTAGRLFQPVYLGQRDDVTPGECLLTQLRYQQAPALAAAHE